MKKSLSLLVAVLTATSAFAADGTINNKTVRDQNMAEDHNRMEERGQRRDLRGTERSMSKRSEEASERSTDSRMERAPNSSQSLSPSTGNLDTAFPR